MLTNHSELVKAILQKNPQWQATYEGLVKEAVPVVLLSVLCPSCDHAHIACLADDEREAFLYADGNEFVRSCARCGVSLAFSTGTVLYKK